MSTPPPPFQPNQPPNPTPPGFGPGPGQPGFGQPGGGQPGFGQPGPPGAPAWQTGGSPTGLQPQPDPPKKSKVPLVIGAAVVVIALIVVGVLVLGGDDDGGSNNVDAAGANAGLTTALRDGSFTDGSEEIDDCPLGDVDELAALVAGAIDVDDEVIDGRVASTLWEEDEDFPGFVSCEITTDEDVRGPYGIYFQAILDPPRDYEGYIEDLYAETAIDFEESQEYLDGEVFLFCGEAMGEGEGFTGCDADWVSADEDIALNVFLYGDGDSDEALDALKAVLPTMAENLAQQADPDES